MYLDVLQKGLKMDGQVVKLPVPRLRDDEEPDARRAELREVAGSDRALEDLLRDSVTAPYIIKVRDVKAEAATIRVADVWFVVHADIAQVNPEKEAARSDGKAVEAGNMAVQTRLLKGDTLRAAGITPPAKASGLSTWYTHLHGRLLGRIEIEVTNQVVASRTDDSIVIASRTDPAFDKPGPDANGWRTIGTSGNDKAEGTLKPYAGGISYSKISRLGFKPGGTPGRDPLRLHRAQRVVPGRRRSSARSSASSPRTRSAPCAASCHDVANLTDPFPVRPNPC